MLIIMSWKSPKTANNFSFLTFEAKLAFLRLRQVFIEAYIIHHFDPERCIRIETNASSYAIDSILSQIIRRLDNNTL